MCLKTTLKAWYLREIWVLDGVKHVFLLILRLYFGAAFLSAGLGKLLNPEATAEFFAGWGIPLPLLNAFLAGTTETVGGLCLLLGVASRLITLPLIGTMLVAYATAHPDNFYAFWGNTALFFKAPPFPYLFTSIVVLLFGPGLFSLDAVLKWYLDRQEARCGHAATL